MDIFTFFRKIKYSIKQIPKVLKNSIEETDFSSTINNILNSPKIKKGIIISSICLIIILILLFFNAYMTRLDGPTVKNLKIENSAYGEITYSGDINNKKIVGDGLLTIVGTKWGIEYNGTFINSNTFNDSLGVQIGDFKNGTIRFVSLESGNTYVFSGEFEDNFLKTGYIAKTINGDIVKYTGSFINNKLNGLGEKYVMINGESKTFRGVFIDNKLRSLEY